MPEVLRQPQVGGKEMLPPFNKEERGIELDEGDLETGEVLFDAAEKTPEKFGQKMVEEIEDMTELLEEEGTISVANIDKELGLPPNQTETAKEQVGFWGKMKGVWGKLRGRSTETISKINEDISERKIETRKEVSIFTPGEIFDPEVELKNVRSMHGKDGREALQKFKEKFANQRLGLAEMEEHLASEIYKNPNVTKEELAEILKKYAGDFAFTEQQIIIAETAIDTYNQRHQTIEKFLAEAGNNPKEIFAMIFGKKPKGKVELIPGPAIYLRCYDLNDFAYIDSKAFGQNREPSDVEKMVARTVGGATIRDIQRIPELNGLVVVENGQMKKTHDESIVQDVYTHELQHVEHQAVKNLLDLKSEKDFKEGSDAYVKLLLDSPTPEEKAKNLRAYFESERKVYEKMAADEILAYLKGGVRTPDQVYNYLSKPVQDGGGYDYFADQEKKELERLGPKLGNDELIKKTAKEVFVDGYHELIKEGIDAYVSLKKGNLSSEMITAVLGQEPLRRWKRMSRLLSEKNTTEQQKLAA